MKKLILAAIALLPLVLPSGVSAHAFGTQYTLPLPVWIFLYGGAAVVTVSFALIGLLISTNKVSTKPTLLLRITDKPLLLRSITLVLKLIGLALLALTIWAGFTGAQDAAVNIAPNLFWIVLLLGLTYFTAIFGDIWPAFNPFQTIVELGIRLVPALREGLVRYPPLLGYFPALIFYLVIIWEELLSGGVGAIPHTVAFLAVEYIVISLIGSVIIGAANWFHYCDFFSVFYRIVGKVSPIIIRGGSIYSRPLLSGLFETEPDHISLVIFIIFMLASTAYDGFRGTTTWFDIEFYFQPIVSRLGSNGYTYFGTVTLLLAPILFFAAYAAVIWLMKSITRVKVTIGELMRRFAFSLVPIVVVYNAAHYFGLVITQAQAIYAQISDPLGSGWNLFGTAVTTDRAIYILPADLTWYIQVGLIVGGHIGAVYIAHLIALKIFKGRNQALNSQLPMLVLMVAYTLTGLWILSQPYRLGG